MRKFLLALVCSVGLPCLVHAQGTSSIDLDVGVLRTKPATGQTLGTPLPDGTLLQLIASSSGTFGNPTAGSFVTGDNVVLESFVVDSSTTANPGETEVPFQFTLATSPTTPFAGEKFELRWYPGLTMTSTAPGTGQTFGQYRSDTSEGFGDAPWVIPAASSSVSVLFTTLSSNNGGNQPDAEGNANLTVTPLPEPSTYAMMGLAAVGLVGMKLRQRRARQS